ncbi:hypothetical protein ACFC26_43230, partial [Kitasatospora purpeofusca]|uniref:hypothetical protein n=1 Tax=Kitasatospora purpeofusca TaxID=67352 RepID=UPI0035E1A4B2
MNAKTTMEQQVRDLLRSRMTIKCDLAHSASSNIGRRGKSVQTGTGIKVDEFEVFRMPGSAR